MVNTSLGVALPIISIFWFIIGAIVPFFIWCGKPGDRWTVRVMLMTTAFFCYLFWLIAFLAQFRPLFGPEIKTYLAAHVRKIWGGAVDAPCYPQW